MPGVMTEDNIPFYLVYLNQKADQILSLAKTMSSPVLVAIDGRCGSGKTTLSDILKEKGPCQVIHMDDFFLRKEQRTEERFAEPGGNMDRERLIEEVLTPLKDGKCAHMRRMDCSVMELKENGVLKPEGIIVAEGSYALHPDLRKFYDLTVFMDVLPADQLERIRLRNGEAKLETFVSRWIPMEEYYFRECRVKDCADLYINTSMQDEI